MKTHISLVLVTGVICAWAYNFPQDMAAIIRYIAPAAVGVVTIAGLMHHGRIGFARFIGISLLRFAEWEENRQRTRRASQYDSLRALASSDMLNESVSFSASLKENDNVTMERR